MVGTLACSNSKNMLHQLNMIPPEHCLEWIRMGVLCRSDITLSVLQWDSETGSRLETEYPIPRKCIDSERILQWAERNAIDLSKEGILESS